MIDETHSDVEPEVAASQRRAMPFMIISGILTALAIYLALYNKLPWTIGGHSSLLKRIVFALRLSFVEILFLIFMILTIARIRSSTFAIDPTDARGQSIVEQPQRILQNTLEQFLVKFILSIVLATLLHSRELILLPVLTILFLIGRITFVIGYPRNRAFGMVMNLVSSVIIGLIIVYRLYYTGIMSGLSMKWKRNNSVF
ncbi:unnamed protein product [Didymodactylos carnosus]|uniref:MAPEG family protein n=1 Tax=Didymodactylos carnosus TaxID=1234261 RepID=A0A815YJG0_9BILA|nr:unnamed protein product [Didymodactylos carnosus]CAF1571322.1 unnamed protein product [Didymodactylos carnosus]CAF3989739.1 unnamed protein product [Didymodactylos carnosus]CAF4434844.1 unnamed protein product [Didymodactylos carnosus]